MVEGSKVIHLESPMYYNAETEALRKEELLGQIAGLRTKVANLDFSGGEVLRGGFYDGWTCIAEDGDVVYVTDGKGNSAVGNRKEDGGFEAIAYWGSLHGSIVAEVGPDKKEEKFMYADIPPQVLGLKDGVYEIRDDNIKVRSFNSEFNVSIDERGTFGKKAVEDSVNWLTNALAIGQFRESGMIELNSDGSVFERNEEDEEGNDDTSPQPYVTVELISVKHDGQMIFQLDYPQLDISGEETRQYIKDIITISNDGGDINMKRIVNEDKLSLFEVSASISSVAA